MPLGFLLQLPTANSLIGFLPMIAIFAIFYFLLFLPMQRQKKQTAEMLANLKSGDEVVSTGGIIGTIVAVNATDDTLVIRVKPDNIKLQVARTAIASLVTKSEKAS
ncbi:MAG: preprotein translocase subunit YajC [Acidobacteria bacterium]|nr:preprotein translocase subunit YajC [Acidobacteriota bacterium]